MGMLHSPGYNDKYTEFSDSRERLFLQTDMLLPKLSKTEILSMFQETRPDEIQPLYAVYFT